MTRCPTHPLCDALKDDSAWCQPIFRWAGSKKKILPILLRSVPSQFSRYVEPFAGSACLFFALRPARAVLADINADLISAYLEIKRHPRRVRRRASSFLPTRSEYYRVRTLFRGQATTQIERSAQFIYLNRFCFNGIYRTNQQGQFNVPFGTDTGDFPPEAQFVRASVALRGATLSAQDFQATVATIEPGDFVYLDPPYSYGNRRDRGEYGPHSFKVWELQRLAYTLSKIHMAGAFFLLSYLDCPELESICSTWFHARIPVRRTVSSFSQHRKIVDELLIANYPLPHF